MFDSIKTDRWPGLPLVPVLPPASLQGKRIETDCSPVAGCWSRPTSEFALLVFFFGFPHAEGVPSKASFQQVTMHDDGMLRV
jgi:hypothetical protein